MKPVDIFFLIGLALSLSGCATLNQPTRDLILPSLVDLSLIGDDKIVQCAPPKNPMLGSDVIHSCVQFGTKEHEKTRIKNYLSALEADAWENGDLTHVNDNPLEPSYVYFYYTKEFPNLGGSRELFILPKPSDTNSHAYLIFESTISVIGKPDCNNKTDLKRSIE